MNFKIYIFWYKYFCFLLADCLPYPFGFNCTRNIGGICYPYSIVCDGKRDCVDNSDEKNSMCSKYLHFPNCNVVPLEIVKMCNDTFYLKSPSKLCFISHQSSNWLVFRHKVSATFKLLLKVSSKSTDLFVNVFTANSKDTRATSEFTRRIQNPIKHLWWAKIVNVFQPSTIFSKNSILDVWQGFEYVSDLYCQLCVHSAN